MPSPRVLTAGLRHPAGRSVLVVLALSLAATTAHAGYDPGRVPEGANALTVRRHVLRLSLLGDSAFGLTDHTQLSTYLLGDAALFPNLWLQHAFVDGDRLAASWTVGVGAGALPVVAGAAVPLPGGVFGAGGVGVVGASVQYAGLDVSLHATPTLTLSIGGGGYALEGGFAGLVAGAGTGGATGGEVAIGGARVGATASAEGDLTLGRRDVLVAAAETWLSRPYYEGGPSGLLYAHAAWTHAWTHFHLSLGAYTFVDLPQGKMLHDSSMPVAPYLNVGWVWG